MKPEISIATVVGDRAAAGPDRIAIRDGARNISYATFAAAIDRVARALSNEGVGPSVKVGIEVAGFYAHWVAIMAVVRLGGISASLSGDGALARAGLVRFDLIASTDRNSPLKSACSKSDSAKFVFMDDDWISRANAAGADLSLPDADIANRALGRIVFSSGTTGIPKGILQPAAMVLAKVRNHAEAIGEDCKFLCGKGIDTTPGREIGTWFRGGTAILPYAVKFEGAAKPRPVTEANWIATSPASLTATMASQGGEFAGREGRLVRVGGAPLPVTLRDDALSRYCARMDVSYGSMELGTMAVGDAALLDRHPGAVGHAIDGIEIEIADPEGNPVAAGIEGAVRVRAPYMIEGYIDNAEATAQFFRGGWFYPGDIGFKEDDGLIVILGRDSDVLNVGGVKFTANAVEHEIRQIEGIGDVCALAVPNRFGVNVMVVLAIGDGAAVEEALEGEIGRVLGAMGLANFITRWTDEIPRTGRGKIARDRLAQDMSRELWG